MTRKFVEDALYPVVQREGQGMRRGVAVYRDERFMLLDALYALWKEEDFLWIGGRLVIDWPKVNMGFEDE